MKKLTFRRKRTEDPRITKLFASGGWTRIKNDVLEKLISNDAGLSKNESQVALAIVRKTWGYRKWADRVSRSQIQKLTNLDLAVISHALKSLKDRRIAVMCKEHSWRHHLAKCWRIEDDTDKWISDRDEGLPQMRNHPLKLGRNHLHKPVRIRPTTKDSSLKETLKYRQTREEATYLEELKEDEARYTI